MTHKLRSEQRADYADNTTGDITGATHQNFVDSVRMNRVRTISSLTGSVTTDDDYIRLDTTANAVTVSLPALAEAGQQPYTFKWVGGANAATIDSGTDNIDGAPDYVFDTVRDSVTLRPGPTEWEIVGQFLNGA